VPARGKPIGKLRRIAQEIFDGDGALIAVGERGAGGKTADQRKRCRGHA